MICIFRYWKISDAHKQGERCTEKATHSWTNPKGVKFFYCKEHADKYCEPIAN